MKCLHRYLPPFSLDIDMVRICPTKLVNWFIRASHTHPHAENGSAYCIVRPTILDKIENLHDHLHHRIMIGDRLTLQQNSQVPAWNSLRQSTKQPSPF